MVTDSVEEVLRRWRDALGAAAFGAAKPGQSLRARTSFSTSSETVAQTTAPNSSESKPKPSFIPQDSTLAQWSEYTVRDLVGEGGMGQIYRADQGALRRDVAIKKIIPEQFGDESDEKREAFVSEALVTGFLDHPNIVPVYALGQDSEGKWFFSMKLVRGIAWKDLLHPGAIADPEKKARAFAQNLSIDDPATRAERLEANLRILLAVCNAVAFAHSKSVIHRDLKPENVMVGAFGEVLVMDWGLAVDVSETPTALASRESRLPHKTDARVGVGGTPDYMAPEQTYGEGDALSAQTDVFLLGAILYELLAGRPPNTAETVIGALTKASQCAPPALPEAIPQELRDICKHAMSKDPTARLANTPAFQQSVEGFLKHKESALIAAKAGKEAMTAEIPNLARAVVLYGQALELWSENAAAKAGIARASSTLAIKERSARRVRRAALGLAAAVFLTVTVAFFWIRNEQRKTALESAEKEVQRIRAVAEAERAEQSATEARKTLAQSDYLQALKFINEDNAPQALAHLARAARTDSENYCVLVRLYQFFLQRGLPRRLGAPMRHNAGVKSIVFSPTGARLASICGREVQLWDPTTQRPAGAPLKHADNVQSVSFSPDGSMLATAAGYGGRDAHGELTVWDARTGEKRAQSDPISGMCWMALWSPRGDCIATAGALGPRLWDPLTCEPKGPALKLSGSNLDNEYVNIDFSRDGSRLLAVSGAITVGSLRLWDVDAQKETALSLLDKGAMGFSFGRISPNGEFVAASTPAPNLSFSLAVFKGNATSNVRFWTAHGEASGQEMVHENEITSLEFSPDGGLLLTGSKDGTAMLWPVPAGAPAVQQFRHQAAVNSARFSPAGLHALTASSDRSARVWNRFTEKPAMERMLHAGRVMDAVFSPDGATIATVTDDGTILLWAAGSPVAVPETLSLGHPSDSSFRSVSTAGDGLLAAADKSVTLHHPLIPNDTPRTWTFDDPIVYLSVGRAQRWCAVVTKGEVSLLALGKEMAHTEPVRLFSGSVHQADFDAAESRVVLACEDGKARVYRTENAAQICKYDHAEPVISACFLPEKNQIASASSNQIHVWSIPEKGEKGALIRVHKITTDLPIVDLSCNQDGSKLLATLGSEADTASAPSIRGQFLPDQVMLFELKPWKALTGLVGSWLDPPTLEAAQISPDDAVLAVTTQASVQIYEASTGRLKTELRKSDDSPVNRTVFNSSGSTLATQDNETTVVLYDYKTGKGAGSPMKHGDKVSGFQFSPDGRLLVTATYAGTARLWDAATGQPLSDNIECGEQIQTGFFATSGRYLALLLESGGIDIHETAPTAFNQAWALGLAQMAECAGGKRLTQLGYEAISTEMPPEEYEEYRKFAANDADFAHFAAWCKAAPDQRTISPRSPKKLSNWIADKLKADNNRFDWRILDMQPVNPEALLCAARSLSASDDQYTIELCKHVLNRVAKPLAARERVWQLLGWSEFRLGNPVKGAEFIEAALKLDANDFDALFDKCVIMYVTGKYDEVMPLLTRTIDSFGHDKRIVAATRAKLYQLRALCYRHNKDLDGAARDVKTIREIAPDFDLVPELQALPGEK